MFPKKWVIVSEVGFIFEFENEDYPGVTIRVIGRDEETARRKFLKILDTKF